MPNDSQYTLLFKWMFSLRDPELTLAEAITYSIIYSFSRDGKGSFVGSYRYLSQLTRLSERQQIRVLNKLIENKLVLKEEKEMGYANEYKCNLSFIPTCYQEIDKKRGYDKMSHPMTSVTNSTDIGGSQMSYINKNKININNKRIVDNVDKSTISPIHSKNIRASAITHEPSKERQLDFAEAGAFNKKEVL